MNVKFSKLITTIRSEFLILINFNPNLLNLIYSFIYCSNYEIIQ